jgi:surface-anchored protein
MMRRFLFGSCFAVLMAGACGSIDAALIEFSAGHADIGVALENGDLELHYHFGSNAVLDGVTQGVDTEYPPQDIYVRVSDSLKITNAPLQLVGLGSGPGDAWILPQTSVSGAPFLGIATEDLPLNFGSTQFSLVGMSGPGEFALWANSGFGLTTYMSTYDGLSSSDQVTLPAATHAHFSYGFTAPGVYELSLQAKSLSNPSLSDLNVFTFVVGDATAPPVGPTAVPEPTSLMLAGLGALGLCGASLRRRSKATA